MLYRFLLILSLLLYSAKAISQDTIIVNNAERIKIGKNVSYYEDESNSATLQQIEGKTFTKSLNDVPNFLISKSSIWLKFTVSNQSKEQNLLVEIDYPNIDDISFYTPNPSDSHSYSVENLGENRPFNQRTFVYQSYLFDLKLAHGQTKTYYLKLKASEQLLVPISIASRKTMYESFSKKDLIFGIYIGIMIIMAIYNLFIYFTVRNKSYLYYVNYIVSVALTQATLQGFSFRFLWPDNFEFNNYSSIFIPFLVGIASLEFFRNFIDIPKVSKKINRGINILEGFYGVSLVLMFFKLFTHAQIAVQAAAFIASLYVLIASVIFSMKKVREAQFFLFAWSIFLLSIFVFVLRNFNILPYNTLTYYALQIGSVIEVTLLSFALADKINVYREEKEQSQEEAYRVLLENERLIREQNVELEKKVQERTEALQETNDSLNQALRNLKDTQSQLVDAEKMASLGQLTAGIAHEINNPINFVTSNIKPLELDINDLKEVITMYENLDLSGDIQQQVENINQFKRQIDIHFVNDEISTLLQGIGEGARRTAEIIRGLKNFSRLDESDTKPVDLNEGLASTVMLIRNSLPSNLEIIQDYGNLPQVECLPGKINQVFMNLVTNAIYAIKLKEKQKDQEFLTIKTRYIDGHVKIGIKDTGTGMTDEVKNKIFEPFFTTKEVGEGTGLGLSIVFKIIETHQGHIEVISKINEGTEFIITLPIKTP